MGTSVHGMAGNSLHVCAQNDFLTISDSSVFVDPNALDVRARKGLFFIKQSLVFIAKVILFLSVRLCNLCSDSVWRACVRSPFAWK